MPAIEEETPLPSNSFLLEDGRRTEAERQAANYQTPLLTEQEGTASSFPLESSGIVGTDLNERESLPLEDA